MVNKRKEGCLPSLLKCKADLYWRLERWTGLPTQPRGRPSGSQQACCVWGVGGCWHYLLCKGRRALPAAFPLPSEAMAATSSVQRPLPWRAMLCARRQHQAWHTRVGSLPGLRRLMPNLLHPLPLLTPRFWVSWNQQSSTPIIRSSWLIQRPRFDSDVMLA